VILVLTANCAPDPRVYSSSGLSLPKETNIAILPFDNLTDEERASQQVYDIFLVEFLKVGNFSVVDPGEVERVLAEERIRYASELSIEQIHKIGRELKIPMIVQGAVLEYGIRQVQGFKVVDVPYISLMVKMVDTQSGKIVWASSYSRNGNDSEKVFGFGRISSLNKLTEVMAREIVESLEEAFRHRLEL
jgi:TolB-like protein